MIERVRTDFKRAAGHMSEDTEGPLFVWSSLYGTEEKEGGVLVVLYSD